VEHHAERTGGHAGLLLNPDFYQVLEPWLNHWAAAEDPVVRAPGHPRETGEDKEDRHIQVISSAGFR
jgi:hypothetical protein